ncbi:MAG TPA: beta-ketoacyl-ACP synthase III [Negativicutes bacterium]|nr:beta-ketoacyl-ACP synthase III [Negativicutes bacterium]
MTQKIALNRNVGILGVGVFAPEDVLTNKDLEKIVDTNDQWITERTGIRERRISKPDVPTSDLAVLAAEKALINAGLTIDDIDLIVVGTSSPDMFYPSVGCLVQTKLKANRKIAAFDLQAGCSGFSYSVIVATQFIRSGMYKTILVIGADEISKMLNWQDRNTCVLFGDGAGALILGEVAAPYGILGSFMGADGAGAELLKFPAGGTRMPATEETVKQNLHSVHMEGNEVFKFAVRVMGEAAGRALEDAGLHEGEIDWLIPHQANMRIIQSAAKRLKMPMEKVIVNLDKYGNTSSASIPLALEEGVRDGRIKPGDIVMMVGFGAGLTWASIVFRWGK